MFDSTARLQKLYGLDPADAPLARAKYFQRAAAIAAQDAARRAIVGAAPVDTAPSSRTATRGNHIRAYPGAVRAAL